MKNCHVDKFGSNDDLDTFICEDINGTFTASTILPLLLLYIANVTISEET